MRLRARFFRESARRLFLSGSLSSTSWVGAVRGVSSGPFLFLAEGVLTYLDENEVKRVFSLLADSFPGCVFAFDTLTAAGRDGLNLDEMFQHAAAALKWTIEDPDELSQWDPRFVVEESFNVLTPWPRDLQERMSSRYEAIALIANTFDPDLAHSHHVLVTRLGVAGS